MDSTMNATTSMKNLLTLLVTAVMATALPAIAQETPPTDSQQIMSRGQSPQNYDVLYVDAVTGNDQQGIGSPEQPYRTITQALRMAPATSTVILLAPGHYSQDSGESFPLRLRPGITIQGSSGETRNTIIFGGGESQVGNVTQNATIVTADRSGLANILVSNAKGSGVWIPSGAPVLRRLALVSNTIAGIQVTDGEPVIENSYFHDNQHGLIIQGNGRALVRGNYFEATGRAITVTSPATPNINNNRIARNQVGIALKNNARPLLNANVLDSNGRNGVIEVEPTAALATPSVGDASTVLASSEQTAKPIANNTSASDNTDGSDYVREQNYPAVLSASETSSSTVIRRSAIAQADDPVTTANISTDIADINNDDAELSNVSDVGSVDRPTIRTAPAPMIGETQPTVDGSTATEIQQTSLPDEPVASLVFEPVIEQSIDDVEVDEAISIAVIPAANALEVSHNNAASSERREGISKLLARLNGSLANESSASEESDAISAPDIPIADIPRNSQRLPVPSVTIPSGSGSLTLTPPGTIALTQTFRYRVLVDMADTENLKQLVPDAFRTRIGNRMFMQAGAYADEVEAQERLEWLQRNGIEGRVDVRN